MLNIRFFKIIILFFISLLSIEAGAGNSLKAHAINIHKAASALYMYQLSNYDERYQNAFLKSLDLASKYFSHKKNQNKNTEKKLYPLWKEVFNHHNMIGLQPKLSNTYRNTLRKYIIQLFQTLPRDVLSSTPNYDDLVQLELDILTVSSYFFDVASNPYGAANLPVEMLKINPNNIAVNINKVIITLNSKYVEGPMHTSIKNISTKWDYIKNNILDYNQKPAYTLVYFYINRISQTIKQSQPKLVTMDTFQ